MAKIVGNKVLGKAKLPVKAILQILYLEKDDMFDSFELRANEVFIGKSSEGRENRIYELDKGERVSLKDVTGYIDKYHCRLKWDGKNYECANTSRKGVFYKGFFGFSFSKKKKIKNGQIFKLGKDCPFRLRLFYK